MTLRASSCVGIALNPQIDTLASWSELDNKRTLPLLISSIQLNGKVL